MKNNIIETYKAPQPSCLSCTVNDCFIKLCKAKELESIDRAKYFVFFKKGQRIISEGHMTIGLYFIHSGKVKVATSWAKEKEQIIRFAKTGDILGYRGFGTSTVKHYLISVTALEDTLVCFIESKLLDELLTNNNHLANCLLHFYAEELVKTDLRIKVVSQKPVRERVAIALIQLYGIFGKVKNDTRLIDVELTRQELSDYVSTTRENTSNFISEFKREGLIGTDERKIFIKDYESLLGLCNLNGYMIL